MLTLTCEVCGKEYQRKPSAKGRFCSRACYRALSVEERFWSHVDIRGPDDCWPWMGSKSKGYGRFAVTRGKQVGAHCFAYELVKGPIPPGLDVLHSCDFPPCCNPVHLWSGTHTDNMQDCVAKGRKAHICGEQHYSHTHPERLARGERHGWRTHPESIPRGERCGSAKLTETKVREIRRLFAVGTTKIAIARLMGVCHATIRQIVFRKTWKHI